jgi:hypothetical protein
MTIHSRIRRDGLDGTPTINDAQRIHSGLWYVELEWPGGRRTHVIALPKHDGTPMRNGTRVRVELLRSDDCAVYLLA